MHGNRGAAKRHRFLVAAIVAVLAAPITARIAYSEGSCVIETQKQVKDGLRILHFRNTCKFPVWAIGKNRDTGHYAIHRVEPGAEHEDPGLKYRPEIVGWCSIDDTDCLREYGMK